MRTRFYPSITLQNILDRKERIAQQYGILFKDDDSLYDFFYLSSTAKKQLEDKIKAYKDGMVYVE